MSDWSIHIPWVYVLIFIHVICIKGTYNSIRSRRKSVKSDTAELENGSFPFKTNQPNWLGPLIFFPLITWCVWYAEYHQILTETATLLLVVSLIAALSEKSLNVISISSETIKTPDNNKNIPLKRIRSIKFAKDHIEIWSKSLIEHYHEFTMDQLGGNWDDFKKELLLAAQAKEWITISTTTISPPAATPPPRLFPLPESETHIDK